MTPFALAIVGSVSLAGRLDVYWLIQEEIEERLVTAVVSGGAEGVDTMAAEVAMMLGREVREHLPHCQRWPCFKKRNLKIAQDCDALTRIVSEDSKTYGSGWTRDRAAEMLKPTREYRVGGDHTQEETQWE